MEVDHPSVWLPPRDCAHHGVVVQRRFEAEPARQVISCSNVVSGKDVQAPKPAQQDVLGTPATDPAEACQSRDDVIVGKVFPRRRGSRFFRVMGMKKRRSSASFRGESTHCPRSRPRHAPWWLRGQVCGSGGLASKSSQVTSSTRRGRSP
jgi:hypothetical protein